MRFMSVENLLRGYIDNNIKPKKEENESIAKYYKEINDLLENYWYYCFISWSYSRWTAISPVNDLDIICESDNQDIVDFMNWDKWKWLHKILSEKYWEDNVDFQSSSIGISFWDNDDDFWIDLVIAKKLDNEINEFWDNLYLVPSVFYNTRKQRREIYKSIKEKWWQIDLIKSDPKWYKQELKNIKDINDNIIYATRFLKSWKRIIKKENYLENEKFLKSFHIEENIKKSIKNKMNSDLLSLLKASIMNFDLIKANIPDRADNSIMIDSYIDREDFDKIKALQQLSILINNLNKLNEYNFEEIMNAIFLIKKHREINIDTKQKSYYAFKW